ncbi:MAG: HNH endonuclease signature motif containing protein [Acidimicrobiales bacterium]
MAEVVECRLQRAVHQLQMTGDPACRVGLLQKIVNLAQELVRIEVRRTKAAGGYAAEGFTSTGAWLACHSGLSGQAARAVARQATELPHLPHSQTAAERGLLHEQQIRLLVDCRRADPRRYDADTDAAFAALPITELIPAARAWKAAAADRRHDPTKPTGAPPETATVHLSQLLDGRWRLDGTLNPHDGTLLNQALDQAIARQLQARRNGDPSVEALPIGSMRAQALVDLAAQALRDHPGNRSRNGRYRINLIVRPGADGTTIEPDRPFPPEAWCDAAWVRTVMGAEGDILDIGRATRDWPEAIWNAIAQRDRTCRFPHCDRPAHWCDAHHCTPWQHGGHTSITNGLLLCRRHHVFVHTHHWTVELDEHQHPVFRQPDGTPFQPRSRAPGHRQRE